LRLLITSREQLRLLAEQRFALRGLSTPPDHAPHTQALDFSASRLFLDRARRLFPDFRVTAVNWPDIAHICRLTEGLPLGIELAVTLLENSAPQELAARITADAAALATDYLDVAPHQRSIFFVFEQSWERLAPAEQRILSRLSIFESNEFSQDAASSVGQAQPHHLNMLVRKSLLHTDASGSYALHPLYKDFASRNLPADQTELRNAHAAYFAQLLTEAVPVHFDKQKHLQLRTLLPLLPDLRAAWHWAATTANAQLLNQLAGPLYRLLRETAQLQDGRALYEHAWERLQTAWPETERDLPQQTALAHLSAQLGFFRLFNGDLHGAYTCLQHALAEFDRLKISEGRGMALAAFSDTLAQLGEYEARLTLWQNELPLAEAGNDPVHLNNTMGNLGEALYQMGQLAEAREIFHRTIATNFAGIPDYSTAITISNLGWTELALGNLTEARQLFAQSLQIRQQYANTYRLASARLALGALAIAEGDYAAAQQELETALSQYIESGRVEKLGAVHLELARVAMKQGDFPTAQQQIRQALAYAQQAQSVAQGLSVLWRWGEFLWAVKRQDEAQAVLAYVLGHPNTSGFLAQDVGAFLAAQGITAVTAGSHADRAWQDWLDV
jgi:tetratricopeptide (TPR) repeat protein